MLLRALQNTEVVTPASLALKDITRETHDHIHPFADQILTACWVSKHVYLYRRSMDANARTVGITYLWYLGIMTCANYRLWIVSFFSFFR